MKILICVSGNDPKFKFETTQVFVWEQIEEIKKQDSSINYKVFAIKGHGIKGYLSELPRFRKVISEYKPDVIHAHCGQVGAFAVLQRKAPVITTFHGSDINITKSRILSSIASVLSKHSIFVSTGLSRKLKIKSHHYSIIPCGVNRDIFKPLAIHSDKPYVLFSSAFSIPIKNYELAANVMAEFPDIELKELVNKSRQEVSELINGSEFVLLTSFSEGSPQIIKEAICCSQKIVSVDVGDVREQISDIPGCRVCSSNKESLVDSINKVLAEPRPNLNDPGVQYDNVVIARQIIEIYKETVL